MSEHNFFHFMLSFKKLKKAREIFLRIKSMFRKGKSLFSREHAFHLADSSPKYFQEVSPFQDPLISFLYPFYPIQLCSNDKLFQPRIHRPKHWSRFWFDPFEQKFRKKFILFHLASRYFFFKRQTYNIQSTANNREISLVGKPKAVSTINIVIKAALGILAAPILAKVAVKLRRWRWSINK